MHTHVPLEILSFELSQYWPFHDLFISVAPRRPKDMTLCVLDMS